MTAFIVVEIGMFSFEWLARAGRLKGGAKSNDLEKGVLEAKELIDEGSFEEGVSLLENVTTKRFVYLFLDGILALKETQPVCPDMFAINVEKLLQKCDSFISKRLERTKVMVRLGPMLGLMGTLIPMGPALLALTSGDVDTLANNLIIAFGTTVVGLLVGSVSYILYTVRRRWYEDDMNDITYICEVLFGGE
jgi:biopolymer transport protein ExbB/TolQ